MSSEKKVSVILPTYNGEKYLAQSIESVLSQTYQNLELIIVDDCSTDGTSEIIRLFAERDSRIRVSRNGENQKLPRSLNIGFRQAAGDYLTWTSDDNFYEDHAIETMVRALERHPDYGMVYCDMTCIYEDGVQLRRPPLDIERFYVDDVVGACFLYRRQVLETVGEYDPDMILVEDYDYWLRVRQQYEVLYLPQRLYQYRFHGSSLTMTKEREVAAQRQHMRLRHLDFLLERASESEREVLFLDMWMHTSQETWALRERFFSNGVLPDGLKWLNRLMEEGDWEKDGRKIILFGAGMYGQKALRYFGADRIICFVDNNEKIWGTRLHNIPVIPFRELKQRRGDCRVVISMASRNAVSAARQLETEGVKDFSIFTETFVSYE